MKKRIQIVGLTLTVLLLAVAGAQMATRRGQAEPGYLRLSSLLGMSTDQFREARRAGKGIEEIAAEQGISKAELDQKLTAQRQERVKERYAAGEITKEQLDDCLENLGRGAGGSCRGEARGQRGQGRGTGRCFANRK